VPEVGPLLQHWRKARRLSQLALAAEAAVSFRHLCFIETGRASPSRAMVLKLAEVLDVPLRDRTCCCSRPASRRPIPSRRSTPRR
jgi:transcriptional regulator with XRE-family HTH domain